MDEEQAVFEKLTLSDFEIRSFSGLKTVNNYRLRMINNFDTKIS